MMAVIYWEPDGGPMRSLALGCLSSWEPEPVHERADSRTPGGRIVRQHLSSSFRVRIGIEAFKGGETEREIASLSTHVGQGKPVGISRYASRSWCGYATAAPVQGATSLTTGGQVWHGAGSASLSSGGEVVLESLDGSFKQEVLTLSAGISSAGTVASFAQAIRYQHGGVAWLRDRYYLPHCIVPEDALAPLLSNRAQRAFTFDMTVEVLPAEIASLVAQSDAPFALGELDGASTQRGASARPSLQDRIANMQRWSPYTGTLRGPGE